MATPAKPADSSAESESRKTVFDMTISEFEAACRETIVNRKPGPVKDYVVVIDENDRIVKNMMMVELNIFWREVAAKAK